MSNTYESTGGFPSTGTSASLAHRPDLGEVAVRHGSSWDILARNAATAISLTSLALGAAIPGQALLMNPSGTAWAPSASGHNDFIDRNVTTTGNVGIGAASNNHKLYVNSGAAPADGQFLVQANALGAVSLTALAADNAFVGFDAAYEASGHVARNASVALWYKTAAKMSLYGSTGNTVGSAATLTQRASWDLGTGAFQLHAYTTPGVLHNNGSGVVSSSLIVDADVTSVGWSKLTGIPDVSNTTHGVVTSITGTGKVLLSGSGTAAVWGAVTDTYISDVAPSKLAAAGAVGGQAMIYSGSLWAPTAGGHNDFIDRNLTTTGTVTASTAFAAPTKLSFKVGSTVQAEIDSGGALKLDAYTNAGLLYNNASGVVSTITNTTAGKVLTTGVFPAAPDWATPTVDWLNITSKPGDVSNTDHGFVTTITGTGKVLLSGTGTAAIWGAITDTYVSDVAWSKLTGVPDASTSAKGIVKLAQDIAGTALLPTVVGISGASGSAAIHCANLTFDLGVTSPTIAQTATTVTNATGHASLFAAQDSNGPGATTGGALQIRSGNGSTAGIIDFQIGGVSAVKLTSTGAIQFQQDSRIRITQAAAAAATDGSNATLRAQDATGPGARTGGSVEISSGAGSGAPDGSVEIQIAGVTVLTILPSGALQLTDVTIEPTTASGGGVIYSIGGQIKYLGTDGVRGN